MTSDEWPAIRVSRFDGEPDEMYLPRRDRIVEIMTGFRKGRFRGRLAEELEVELIALQDPASQVRRPVSVRRQPPSIESGGRASSISHLT